MLVLTVSSRFFYIPPVHSQMHVLGPMHPYLKVDEILRLIVCELVESEAKATAVALACCSKSFEDPVLDALWETQDGLLPLLNSLPADVWSEGGYTVSVPTTHVFSPLNYFIEKSFKRPPQRRNGLVSGSTLERYESSEDMGDCPSCLQRFSRFWSTVPLANPCSRT